MFFCIEKSPFYTIFRHAYIVYYVLRIKIEVAPLGATSKYVRCANKLFTHHFCFFAYFQGCALTYY